MSTIYFKRNRKNIQHNTGYWVFIGGDRYWHRLKKCAIARANASSNFHARDITQVINVKTGNMVWGRAR